MAVPGSYKVNFTDPTKPNATNVNQRGFFIINPDTTDGTIHPLSAQLDLRATRSETSLLFYGLGVPNYGERIAENFVHLLEHFAGPIEPKNPIHGQIWVKKGRSFDVNAVSISLTLETITIVDDHVSWIQTIIDTPGALVRIINVDTLDFWEATPQSVALVGGNTVITLPNGTLGAVSSLDLVPANLRVTSDTNRSQILWYDDGRMSSTAGVWRAVQGAVVSNAAPHIGIAGEMWVDLSETPPMLKVHDGTDYNIGVLSVAGGTMTGALLLHSSTHVDPLEATSKSYVDDGISAAVALLSGDINSLVVALNLLDGRVSQNEFDITTLQGDVTSIEAEILLIQSDITSLTNNLNGKLDLTGGTMSGDVVFNIPNASASPKIAFVGTAATSADGFNTSMFSESDGITVTHNIETEAPLGGNSNTLITYQNAGDVSPTVILDMRKNGIGTHVGIFETSSIPLVGDPFDSLYKYQTRADINLLIDNGIGPIVNDLSWDAVSKTLTMTKVFSALVPFFDTLDLSHNHDPEDLSFIYAPARTSNNETVPQEYPSVDEIPFSAALNVVDIRKSNVQNGEHINPVSNFNTIESISQDPNTNSIVISDADLVANGIEVGDDVVLRNRATAGFAEIDFSGVGSPIVGSDNTGLNPLNTYVLAFTVDGDSFNYAIRIENTGAILATFDDIVNEINTAIAAASPTSPVSPVAIAQIVGGNLVITSNRLGGISSVEFDDFTMILSTSAYQSPSPTPDVNEIAGKESNITVATSVSAIDTDVPLPGQHTVTVTNSLSGLTADSISVLGVPTTPSQDYHLVTAKEAQRIAANASVPVQINWIGAAQEGAGLSIPGELYAPSIAALNGTDIAFFDNVNQELRTYRWNGSAWALVGSGLSIPTGVAAISALNGTDIAFFDSTNQRIRTYRWNGSTWALVGTGLSMAVSIGTPSMTSLSGTDVAFVDSASRQLRTFRWNGSAWAMVGSALTLPLGAGYPTVVAMSAVEVTVFLGQIIDELHTYRWNDTAWEFVDATPSITGSSITSNAMTALNGTDIVFNDGHGNIQIYRKVGTTFQAASLPLTITTGMAGITAMNGTDVAFINNMSKELCMYRFAFYVGAGPHNLNHSGF